MTGRSVCYVHPWDIASSYCPKQFYDFSGWDLNSESPIYSPLHHRLYTILSIQKLEKIMHKIW